jgi:hypothetical protein
MVSGSTSSVGVPKLNHPGMALAWIDKNCAWFIGESVKFEKGVER